MQLLIPLLYILFVVAAIVLIVVVLIQEGKGGGLGGAFGSAGQETFGVGAKGINTFTAWTAGIFLSTAIVIHILHRQESVGTVLEGPDGPVVAPLAPDGGSPPVGGTAPSAGGGAGTSGTQEGS